MPIFPHYQRAIDRLIETYRNDPRYLALIIGGSIAKGCARQDSDVDFLIVASDLHFDRCLAKKDLFINRRDLCDYDGGYVDGKIINLSFLQNLAEKGNEPSRAAFEGAFLGFSHIPNLHNLIDRITVYPEHDRDRRIRAFYCMAFIQHWLIHEAARHGNRYTITRAASQLALYTGRLFLAYNRKLYPYHKWLMHALTTVEHKPEQLLPSLDLLLSEPSPKHANAVFDQVRTFHDWGISDLDAYTWFMTEVEWSWMYATTPMEDW